MKSEVYISGLILVIVVLFVTAFRRAGPWLVKEDITLKADAMVLLMGSIPDRVLQAADLCNRNSAHNVILVESSMEAYKTLEQRGVQIISETRQVCNALRDLGIPANSITILPGNATSTQLEALMVRNYLADKPSIDTLLLVSSAEHMRRASMIFKVAFRSAGKDITILCSPSKYTDFCATRWWKDKEWVQKVVMEYGKMANFLLFDRRKLKIE